MRLKTTRNWSLLTVKSFSFCSFSWTFNNIATQTEYCQCCVAATLSQLKAGRRRQKNLSVSLLHIRLKSKILLLNVACWDPLSKYDLEDFIIVSTFCWLLIDKIWRDRESSLFILPRLTPQSPTLHMEWRKLHHSLIIAVSNSTSYMQAGMSLCDN